MKALRFLFWMIFLVVLAAGIYWYMTTPQPMRADQQLAYARDEAAFRLSRLKPGQNYEGEQAALQSLADKGNIAARLYLAQTEFARAESNPAAYTNARELLQPVAEQGVPLAQNALGIMTRDGLGGIMADRVEAYKWFLLAAGQGMKQAEQHALKLSHTMTEAEINDGKARSEKWLADYRTKPTAMPDLAKLRDSVEGSVSKLKDKADSLRDKKQNAELAPTTQPRTDTDTITPSAP